VTIPIPATSPDLGPNLNTTIHCPESRYRTNPSSRCEDQRVVL